jgi:phenylalanyl-tRNA synthetase beta chain
MDQVFSLICRKDPGNEAVVLENPKSEDFQIARSMLFPGLLKTLTEHRSTGVSNGVKLFECSDVVLQDHGQNGGKPSDTGARNERRFAAVYTGSRSGFEIIHGLLDRVMQLLDVAPSEEYSPEGAAQAKALRKAGRPTATNGEYSIAEDPNLAPADSSGTFFPGRGAMVLYRKSKQVPWKKIGFLGTLHPRVIKNFELSFPASAIELTIQEFE